MERAGHRDHPEGPFARRFTGYRHIGSCASDAPISAAPTPDLTGRRRLHTRVRRQPHIRSERARWRTGVPPRTRCRGSEQGRGGGETMRRPSLRCEDRRRATSAKAKCNAGPHAPVPRRRTFVGGNGVVSIPLLLSREGAEARLRTAAPAYGARELAHHSSKPGLTNLLAFGNARSTSTRNACRRCAIAAALRTPRQPPRNPQSGG